MVYICLRECVQVIYKGVGQGGGCSGEAHCNSHLLEVTTHLAGGTSSPHALSVA